MEWRVGLIGYPQTSGKIVGPLWILYMRYKYCCFRLRVWCCYFERKKKKKNCTNFVKVSKLPNHVNIILCNCFLWQNFFFFICVSHIFRNSWIFSKLCVIFSYIFFASTRVNSLQVSLKLGRVEGKLFYNFFFPAEVVLLVNIDKNYLMISSFPRFLTNPLHNKHLFFWPEKNIQIRIDWYWFIMENIMLL